MDVLHNTVNEFTAKYKHTHPVAKVRSVCRCTCSTSGAVHELLHTSCLRHSADHAAVLQTLHCDPQLLTNFAALVQACDACVVFAVASCLLQVRCGLPACTVRAASNMGHEFYVCLPLRSIAAA